ncbi:MAG: PxKF domain-containing protein, partial [Candidatus Paceibacterota bacterium]
GSGNMSFVSEKVENSATVNTAAYYDIPISIGTTADIALTETNTQPLVLKSSDGATQNILPSVGTGDTLPDTIAPQTTATPIGTLGQNNWYTSDVSLTFSATDLPDAASSGVYETRYSLDDGTTWATTTPVVISTEGTTVIMYYSVDNAGNIEATSTISVKIDKTAPEVAISSPTNGGEYFLNQNILAEWSAADTVSGMLLSEGTTTTGASIDTGTIGEKTYSVFATDNAGNASAKTVTYSVRYDYGGILQPINADGKSIFKLGSTVPVKFRIKYADGNFISTATANIYVNKISNGVLGTETEAVSTSAATSGNLFRYDTIGNQYVFNLATKPLSVGTWQIRIAIDDGTSKTVTISLR